MQKKSIVFTGGGTTGHVTKNIILIEALKKEYPELDIHYIGSRSGKEAELITPELAAFHPISTGKLRRYFSLQTIPDFFRFFAGIWQSYGIITELACHCEESPQKCGDDEAIPSGKDNLHGTPEQVGGDIKFIFSSGGQAGSKLELGAKMFPSFVFSSGGYVALPVCIAAWLRGIPIITHETDSVPGLANRIIGRLATKILLGFESAAQYFDSKKTIYTGNPVSPRLFDGSREHAFQKLGFTKDRKTILVMGGSQGAEQINDLIAEILPELLKTYQVIHLTGKGKILSLRATMSIANGSEAIPRGKDDPHGIASSSLNAPPRNDNYYRAFEYVTTDYPDFLDSADLVISRAGGNSLAEIEALGKPAIIIPLATAASDHQTKNAEEMVKKNPTWTILKNPSSQELLKTITAQAELQAVRSSQAQELAKSSSPLSMILQVFSSYFS